MVQSFPRSCGTLLSYFAIICTFLCSTDLFIHILRVIISKTLIGKEIARANNFLKQVSFIEHCQKRKSQECCYFRCLINTVSSWNNLHRIAHRNRVWWFTQFQVISDQENIEFSLFSTLRSLGYLCLLLSLVSINPDNRSLCCGLLRSTHK